jgi:hypothetical protein
MSSKVTERIIAAGIFLFWIFFVPYFETRHGIKFRTDGSIALLLTGYRAILPGSIALPPEPLAFLGLLSVLYSESKLKESLVIETYPEIFWKILGWMLLTVFPILIIMAF